MLELTAVERVAVNSAVSGKVLNIARGELVEGESHTLDFAVRIFGTISRGHGTPGGSSEVPADVNLKGHAVALELLQRLGIGPKRLRTALEEMVGDAVDAGVQSIGEHTAEQQPKLAAVFGEVAAAAAEQLPKATRTTNGRAGSITSSLDVEKVATA